MEEKDVDLCIVGAGLAGLNALFVSSEYLDSGSSVLLTDKREKEGGMWNDVYSHVRLHQPYKLFTVGNFDWAIKKHRSHLADKGEILKHFSECKNQLRLRFNLEERYLITYVRHEEVSTENGYVAYVYYANNDSKEIILKVKAKRFIKALSYNVQPQIPWKLSTDRVRSITQESFKEHYSEMAKNNKPIYILGSGKSGTDAAYELIKKFPGREIHMFGGRGTAFFNRDNLFPNGTERWVSNKLVLDKLLELTLQYDGEDHKTPFKSFLKKYGIDLDGQSTVSAFGVISENEISIIKDNLTSYRRDYLIDVIEKDDRLYAVLKSGKEIEVEESSWIVSCQGYLWHNSGEREDLLSQHKTTLSIQQSSTVFFLSSFSAYFLPHLFYSNKIDKIPLAKINLEKLRESNKEDFFIIVSAQLLYNLLIILENTPLKVITNCALNFDNWFPKIRIVAFLVKLKLNKRKYIRHLETSLNKAQGLGKVEIEF
jgi:hypothetical protein